MPPRKKPVVAPDVFDLDAAIAEIQPDAAEQPFKFSYQGKEWTMRPASDSDARLLANLELNETQQIMAYMRDLLGDQWDDFPRISFTGAIALVEKYSEYAQGLTPGESEASANS